MKAGHKKIALFAAVALLAGGAGIALAQNPAAVSAALADGSVGEQADGYLGFRKVPLGDLRAEVDAINIKRRDAYTKLAAQRGVTLNDVAAAIGCETLSTRVAQGRSYKLPDGVWRVKAAMAIDLPTYCGG